MMNPMFAQIMRARMGLGGGQIQQPMQPTNYGIPQFFPQGQPEGGPMNPHPMGGGPVDSGWGHKMNGMEGGPYGPPHQTYGGATDWTSAQGPEPKQQNGPVLPGRTKNWFGQF